MEGKEYLGDGYTSRDGFNDEDLPNHDKFCDTPIFFEITMWPRWECTSSCHEIEYSEYVEYSKDHLQHRMNQIL